MRSLHIIASKQPGGAEGFFVRLVQALNDTDHYAGAIVAPGSAVSMLLPGTVARTGISMRGHWDLYARHRIRSHIRRTAPDIVMSYLGRATRLVRLPKSHRPTHIARLGGYYDLKQYAHAHAWVGNTRGICDYLVHGGMPPQRVFHIPNFADACTQATDEQIAATRAELHLPADARVILALGRLHTIKGFDVLLRAFAELNRSTTKDEHFLVVLGEGAERADLEKAVRETGIAERTRFPGWRTLLAPHFAIADAFVCPSRAEPFGNVLLEAWSHGVPLIATRTAGAMELVEHGKDGVLVPIDNAEAIARELKSLLASPASEKQQFIDAGRAKIASTYSREAIVGAYLELFSEVGSC